MPILKFTTNDGKIVLDSSVSILEDITHDKRTSMIDKKSFMKDKYKIDQGVYLALNDMFFKMAKIFNKNKPIGAMLIADEGNHIIIVPSRSYVFWQGRSVDPIEYNILHGEMDIMKLLKVAG